MTVIFHCRDNKISAFTVLIRESSILPACNQASQDEWKNSPVPEIVCFNSGVYPAEKLNFLFGTVSASDHKGNVLAAALSV